MGAVGEPEPFLAGPGEVRDQVGAVPAGLLILPLAGEEHRDVDLVHQRDRVERVSDLGPVVVVVPDRREQLLRLAVQSLVLLAGLVPAADLLLGVWLGVLQALTGRLGFLLALNRPRDSEAGVKDAARVQRCCGRVDRRQRRDRLERRRVGLGGEQLADRPVGDPDHSDLVVEHPRLVGDGLDHVVAVEVLERLEEVVGAARAAGAAHAHVDDREPHRVQQRRDPVHRTAGVGVPVARVLDHGRVRGRVGGQAGRKRERQAGDARDLGRRPHGQRELGAVARGQVLVAVVIDCLVVDLWIPRRVSRRVDR